MGWWRRTAVAVAVTTVGVVSACAPTVALADTTVTVAGSRPTTASVGMTSVSQMLWQNPSARYIVILGAKMGTLGQMPSILSQRLDTGAALARSHPFNRVIVSGGDTWWLPVSEAQFMNVGLLKRGVPPWQMLNEDRSQSTVQNATNTVAILKALHATGAVIVTNPFHMTRALDDFRTAARQQHLNLVLTPDYA